MPTTSYNLVTFQPSESGQKLFLTLQSDWVISGGLRADFNVAIVPRTEAAKLPSPLPDVLEGRVEFFFDSVTVPSVTLDRVYLIDIAIDELGKSPGSASLSVQSYRLTFADHRTAFAPPRGPRIRLGELNPDPTPEGFTLKNNKELIIECLKAMNFPGAAVNPDVVPETVNAVPPLKELEWHDTPAADALGKLLQHCGHVYAPQNDGSVSIVRANTGNEPVIPAARLSYAVQSAVVDRRPRHVIFTSAPTCAIRTFTSAYQGSAQWEFVVQSHEASGKWRRFDQVSVLGDEAAVLAKLKKHLADIPEEVREQYDRQLFKAIRITNAGFDVRNCPILRRVFLSEELWDDPYLRLNVAVKGKDGAWVNKTVRLKAKTIVGKEGVLVFEERLGTVSGTDRADRDMNFVPATADSIKPFFSIEDWDSQKSAKKFAVFGFKRQAQSIVDLTETLAADRLSGLRLDTAIYNSPDLRLIDVDGTSNRADLNIRARAYAEKLLADEAVQEKEVEATGFLATELSGRVSEVRYCQQPARTIILLDAWHVQSRIGGRASEGRQYKHQDEGGGAGALRQSVRSPDEAESRAQTPSRFNGATGEQRPLESLGSEPAEEKGFRLIFVTVSSPVAGQLGFYLAKSISGRINTAPSGNLSIAMLGTQPASDDVLLEFTGDIGGTSPGGLKAGDVIAAWAGPVQQSDGKLIAIAAGPRMKKKSVMTNWTCANGTATVTKEDVWVFDV